MPPVFTVAEGKQKLYENHKAIYFTIMVGCFGKTAKNQQLTLPLSKLFLCSDLFSLLSEAEAQTNNM